MAIDDPYVSTEDFKNRASISKPDQDSYILNCLKTASRVIESWSETIFNQSAPGTVRYYTAWSLDHIPLDPFVTLTAVATDAGDDNYSQAWDLDTDLYFGPRNAPGEGRPFTELRTKRNSAWAFPCDREEGVRITGTWGWPAVPPNIIEATYLLAHRYFKRWGTPFGIVGTAELGTINVLIGRDRDVREIVFALRARGVSF